MRRLALKLQLRFPDEAETRFVDAYRAGTITTTRLALALAIVLYTLFAILDVKVMPLSKPELWLIRFAVVCPILILVLALTYVPSLARQTQALLFTAVLAAGLGIVAMLAVARE
ncbi:MAG: hypothetical protein IT201_09440, partial [Thermoleophilia bacterium]|nr:hypothetical protein [Thermoleophilia bacterium]